MRVDLDDLRLYLAVLDRGSITAGADQAHLSLSAASERLARLEGNLGVRLFERSRQGVTPTAAGVALTPHARAVASQIECLRSELKPYAEGLRGRIRMHCNTAALTEFLPEALGAYLAAHPDVDIDLQESWSSEIVESIRGLRADIGILSDAVDTSDLELRHFREDRLVVLMPAHHPLSRRSEVGFIEVVKSYLVGLTEDSALNRFLQDQARRSGINIQYRARLRSFDLICRMVAQGAGLAIVPQGVVERLAHGAVCVAPLSDRWARRRLLLCAQSFRALPAYVRELVDTLKQP